MNIRSSNSTKTDSGTTKWRISPEKAVERILLQIFMEQSQSSLVTEAEAPVYIHLALPVVVFDNVFDNSSHVLSDIVNISLNTFLNLLWFF
jgi:hypothetical protein